MIRIESKNNPFYKSVRALRDARESRVRKQVFLEGVRLCLDALQSGAAIDAALAADSAVAASGGADSAKAGAGEISDLHRLLQDLPAGTAVYTMPDHLFASLCATENPQGIALVCRSPLLETPGTPPKPDGLYLVAAEIQDPGNLGNMIRCADAFAFDGVLLTGGTVNPLNDKVLRAAMGSCFHIPLLAFADLRAVADFLSAGCPAAEMIAAVLPDPGRSAEGWPGEWPVPAAIVIGNEARGLPPEAVKLCGRRAAIPMPGRAESLNASAAAAIFCFELMMARAGKSGRTPVSDKG